MTPSHNKAPIALSSLRELRALPTKALFAITTPPSPCVVFECIATQSFKYLACRGVYCRD